MALLTVKDFMSSPVVTAEPEERVELLVKAMDKHNIGSVVIQRKGRVLGIVTERDIMRRACARDRSISETRAQDIMSSEVISISPEASILELSNTMHKHYFRHVLVVARDKLLGIVSAKDLIGVLSIGTSHAR